MDTASTAARLQTLKQRLEEDLVELEKGIADARDDARRELTGRLNCCLRQLRLAKNRDEWDSAFVDRAMDFCGRALLFAVAGESLRGSGPLRGIEVPLVAAPAFASAVESAGPVVWICAADQLSQEIAALLGGAVDGKVYLFPILVRPKVMGVLCAEGDERPVDEAGLELLAEVGGACWPAREGPRHRGAAPPQPEEWAAFPRAVQDLHLQAQRFARVQVAEMRLYKAAAVKAGRARGNLYFELKDDIDSARETFRRQYGDASGRMADYLHMELVRTLANDDAALLGGEYPGPLL
jgi:hypothetical protein